MRDNDLDRRAARIGDAAPDLDAGPARDAYIGQACGGDRALLSLVCAYVAKADGASPLFDGPAIPVDLPSDTRIGQRVGHWKLLRILGEGGFGVVYLAERCDGEVRQLGAVKFLRGTIRNRDFELRFRDERQILANLHSPYIVGLIDAGVTTEGQPYLVMEFMEDAKPIDTYCREDRLAVADCLRLFQRICEAVAYAHQRMIVHRDLKPENILVTRDGLPHLLDFGVAKILDPIHRSGDRLAPSTNVLVGTQRYFSPEQAKREPVDTTTDIYSLGVILYELLTGTDPYNLDRWRDDPIEKVICTVDPEPPSKALLRSGSLPTRRQHELQGDLDAIVLMALRKERERRYRTVVEFSDDIRRHLENRPIQARPDSFVDWTKRFMRRHKAQMTGAAAGLAASSLMAGGLYFATQSNRHQYSIAGAGAPQSRYTVDDWLYLRLNGHPIGFGKFTGCGPPATPSTCPETAAIRFTGAS
jgi:serine/threonine protein kinase